MNKAVMISIQPKWCELIASGKKTIEVRKTAPKIDTPFKCYIYMTATKERCRFWEYITAYQNSKGEILDGSQKVIGEFTCNEIEKYEYSHVDGVDIDDDELLETCLDREEINIYAHGKTLYGLHISDLVIYDTPKELGEFWKYGYENDYDAYSAVGGGMPISFNSESYKVARPPQSWCYVEEV